MHNTLKKRGLFVDGIAICVAVAIMAIMLEKAPFTQGSLRKVASKPYVSQSQLRIGIRIIQFL